MCAVCGPLTVGSHICSALPWSAQTTARPPTLSSAASNSPTPASVASTALIVAGKEPVWPTMSGLAKFTTTRPNFPERIAALAAAVTSAADISGCMS